MASYDQMKVTELKAELKKLGLPQQGLKADLLARLHAATSATDSPAEALDSSVSQDVNETVEPADGVNEGGTTSRAVADATTSQDEPLLQASPLPPSASPSGTIPHIKQAGSDSTGKEAPRRDIDRATPEPGSMDAEEAADHEESHSLHLAVDANSHATRPQSSGAELTPQPSEASAGLHKRKERSSSPEAVDAETSRKRVRQEDHEEDSAPLRNPSSEAGLQLREEPQPFSPEGNGVGGVDSAMEIDSMPSVHPATSALYIKNFMRPLRAQDIKDHLIELAAGGAGEFDESIILNFHLDAIRTHAFVVFKSVTLASRVRSSLHDRIWPNETNRKPLWVDFVPAEKVPGWIETEMDSYGGRGAADRFEVTYGDNENGNVTATHGGVSNIPTGPRNPQAQPQHSHPSGNGWSAPQGFDTASNAPAARELEVPDALALHPSRRDQMGYGNTTRANPPVSWQPVTDELVDRRLDSIAAAKTKQRSMDFGKDYHRYFFEQGDLFVDRGKEYFLAIRPPRRERERRRELAEGRRGFNGGPGIRDNRRGSASNPYRGVPRGGDRYRGQASDSYGFNERAPYRDEGNNRGRYRRDNRY